MKLYKFKIRFIKNIQLCTDWKLLKKIVLIHLSDINHELKRPRVKKGYSNKRRSPKAIKLEKKLYKNKKFIY